MSESPSRVEREALAKVGVALDCGEEPRARALLADVIARNPRSVEAWSLACQASETDAERIACLQRILVIEPNHEAAKRSLARIRASRPKTAEPDGRAFPSAPDLPPNGAPSRPRRSAARRRPGLLSALRGIPAGYAIGVLAVLGVLLGAVYVTVNCDWFGLAEPDWDRLIVSSSAETIQGDEQTWRIVYERAADSRFAGLVRHASLIRSDQVPFLTHDILVTSGDYADPDLVRTRVMDHHFFWRSVGDSQPQGAINLLHTMAVSQDIYRRLLQVRPQDQVVIVGREVLRVELYDREGAYLGNWHDTGCNTLLVRSVEIASR